MTPTRPTRSLRRAAIALAAVPVLAATAACGDDDGGDDSAFCGQVESHMGAVLAPTTGVGMDESITALEQIQPPAEIAADWSAMLNQLRAVAAVDMSNPDPAQLGALDDPAAQQATTNIAAYVTENCEPPA